ncbi:MAG: hypothetical protein ACTHJ7_08715 [Candidatus Nitrosocosmicus sp.]
MSETFRLYYLILGFFFFFLLGVTFILIKSASEGYASFQSRLDKAWFSYSFVLLVENPIQ